MYCSKSYYNFCAIFCIIFFPDKIFIFKELAINDLNNQNADDKRGISDSEKFRIINSQFFPFWGYAAGRNLATD